MARSARQTSIDPDKIQIVHVWNRCVRRAFLCGADPYSGRNYEHRREWAQARLRHLASLFAIDCITYSIMSNHTHQVLRSRPDIAQGWGDHEVALRWLRISPVRNSKGEPLEPDESDIEMIVSNPERVAQLRRRLSDVSWWMRYFSHYMACRANKEDEVSGHFWESRFSSEVLESDGSVLTCMIYVDLNPVRAGIADCPEDSEFTGAKDRIDDLRISLGTTELGRQNLTIHSDSHAIHDWERVGGKHSGWISPVEVDEAHDPIGPDPDDSTRRASRKGVLAISLLNYLRLLDWVGRVKRDGKRGTIPPELPPVLSRLGLSDRCLLRGLRQFGAVQLGPTAGLSKSMPRQLDSLTTI